MERTQTQPCGPDSHAGQPLLSPPTQSPKYFTKYAEVSSVGIKALSGRGVNTRNWLYNIAPAAEKIKWKQLSKRVSLKRSCYSEIKTKQKLNTHRVQVRKKGPLWKLVFFFGNNPGFQLRSSYHMPSLD